MSDSDDFPKYEELVEKCDPETKLAVAAWTVSKIVEHGKNPGSFRHLIYGLMGFGPEAYVPMYYAGGMDITNEFDLNIRDDLKEVIREEKIENTRLKKFAGMCDEPDCFETASCGSPSDSGYRWTCNEHSNFKFLKKEENNG
jgi:hypothetical protein